MINEGIRHLLVIGIGHRACNYNDDAAMEDAVIEHKIGIIVFIIDDDTLLAGEKDNLLIISWGDVMNSSDGVG